MTLGEAKEKVYMLLDEHSSGGVVSHDPDLEVRMARFFDMAQKQVARRCPVIKTAVIDRQAGVTEYPLPADLFALRRVWQGEENVLRRCRWRGGKLALPEGAETVTVEYCAVPGTVDGSTDDGYAFEVSEDAAQAMPFFVAALQLAADPTADGAGLMEQYHVLLSALSPETPGDGTALRQGLYRGA